MNANELFKGLQAMKQGELDKAAAAYENALKEASESESIVISDFVKRIEIHLLKAKLYDILREIVGLLSTDFKNNDSEAITQRKSLLKNLQKFRKVEKRLIKYAKAAGLVELL